MKAIIDFVVGLDLRGFNEWAVVLRFLMAILCGGIIGLEREHKHRPAGFRTHILVCFGSALAMMTSQYLISLGTYVCDPARLGAQVIAGMGFIGAGTIIVTKRRQVKGLTTAAGLWSSAIIGLAIGAGYYEAGAYATFLILVVELLLSRLDWFLISNVRTINVYVGYNDPECLVRMLAILKENDVKVLDIEITKSKLEEDVHISAVLYLKLAKKGQNEKVLAMLSGIEGVSAVEEL